MSEFGSKPYIIAEIGCNHNGDMELAKKMIDSAKENGADAVKFQLFTKENLFSNVYLNELNEGVSKLENVKSWKTESLGLTNVQEQIEHYAIQYDEHVELFDYCRKVGIDYASTPVERDGVDFLVEQKVKFIKLASMDANNIDYINYCLNKNVPTVLSTGMASLSEIDFIVNNVPKDKLKYLNLLHCVSIYPPDDKAVNLKFMQTLQGLYPHINIGYSDHTLGFSIPLAAIALGATLIEKHFTLDKDMPGWDHKVSANPFELKIICEEGNRVMNSLGLANKILSEQEVKKRYNLRRSWVAKKNIPANTILTEEHIVLKRPANGFAPNDLKYILGRTSKLEIKEDYPVTKEDLV